jgi:hypothetical protein
MSNVYIVFYFSLELKIYISVVCIIFREFLIRHFKRIFIIFYNDNTLTNL